MFGKVACSVDITMTTNTIGINHTVNTCRSWMSNVMVRYKAEAWGGVQN